MNEAEKVLKEVILDLRGKGMTKKEIKNHIRADVVDMVFQELKERKKVMKVE